MASLISAGRKISDEQNLGKIFNLFVGEAAAA